jgi:hypothetical protein
VVVVFVVVSPIFALVLFWIVVPACVGVATIKLSGCWTVSCPLRLFCSRIGSGWV